MLGHFSKLKSYKKSVFMRFAKERPLYVVKYELDHF